MQRNLRTFADRALSIRLEETEGLAAAAFVDVRARQSSGCGAERMETGGIYAMFDGPASPVTQTFGLGMSGPVTAELLDVIESFFFDRGAEVQHEVSPFADESVWALLSARGYVPFEYSSVMFLDLPAEGETNDIAARAVEAREHEQWALTAAEGWKEYGFDPALMRMALAGDSVVPFVAELHGKPIATGALNIQKDVGLLAGASTIAAARGLGAQRALLNSRLQYAAQAGCTVAMFVAQAGSASQRNAERRGFRIAYTRCKWRRTFSL